MVRAQIAELTPLSSRDLIDVAVDVAWFQRIHKQLKPARWTQLDDAAKYASGGAATSEPSYLPIR
ncbi:MAG: DUF5724 domain-containing protein [Cyanobacteria bacterium P01_F01_bin.53]